MVEAAKNVELAIRRGETLGIVGESGSGKSTVARCIARLIDPTSGEIYLDRDELAKLSRRRLREHRRRIQIVFQDPYRSLNPRRRVGDSIIEGPVNYGMSRGDAMERAKGLMSLVRLDPNALDRYPHQFSGGQRQRLLIAGALACRPRLVIADEPTSALDVTTQLQILRLLRELTATFGLSMLFVTHDFGVVAQLCDDVMVMYAGQSVEAGPTAAIIDQPRHPYTQMLIACHPDRARDLSGIRGIVPSPLRPPGGCRFHPRCPVAQAGCADERPRAVLGAGGHGVSCVLYHGRPAPERVTVVG